MNGEVILTHNDAGRRSYREKFKYSVKFDQRSCICSIFRHKNAQYDKKIYTVIITLIKHFINAHGWIKLYKNRLQFLRNFSYIQGLTYQMTS